MGPTHDRPHPTLNTPGTNHYNLSGIELASLTYLMHSLKSLIWYLNRILKIPEVNLNKT